MSEQIRQIRNQTLERISELTLQPKPSYSIDGQSVSWNEYLNQLQRTVDWCNAILASEEPCVIHSVAVGTP
ncbi:MAG: hypothetical protein ACRC10_01330 [Thermoguttaceae bacterium]